jgi:myo-inositol-1(or 4)-monophosphatase
VNGDPVAVAAGRPLSESVVATHVPTGDTAAAELAALLVRRAGVVRSGGSGSLELAWLASGRIDGWIQHAPAPWDWEPGAILVAEAGGTVLVRGSWHIAGSPQVAAELASLVA